MEIQYFLAFPLHLLIDLNALEYPAAIDIFIGLFKKLKRSPCYKLEFCDFALWNLDCNLASSFSSKVVLSGRMERLAQRNKIKLRIATSF